MTKEEMKQVVEETMKGMLLAVAKGVRAKCKSIRDSIQATAAPTQTTRELRLRTARRMRSGSRWTASPTCLRTLRSEHMVATSRRVDRTRSQPRCLPIMIRTERGRAFMMHLAFFNDGGSHNVALKQMMVMWAKRKRDARR